MCLSFLYEKSSFKKQIFKPSESSKNNFKDGSRILDRKAAYLGQEIGILVDRTSDMKFKKYWKNIGLVDDKILKGIE
jgi:hypothetical protein